MRCLADDILHIFDGLSVQSQESIGTLCLEKMFQISGSKFIINGYAKTNPKDWVVRGC